MHDMCLSTCVCMRERSGPHRQNELSGKERVILCIAGLSGRVPGCGLRWQCSPVTAASVPVNVAVAGAVGSEPCSVR